MRFSQLEKSDLVINMTLAEIFLLLLFVVWYGYTDILNPDPYARIKEQIVRLEKENKELKKKLREANDQIADLQRRLDLWHQLTGFEIPPSLSELIEWRKEACRSFPKCDENNILVHVSVIRGRISMVWLTESPELSQWLSKKRLPKPQIGVPITDQRIIRTLLKGVRDYYSYRKATNGTECRFDYRLTYESKEDYYDGRELFEHYFYPAGIVRTNAVEQ